MEHTQVRQPVRGLTFEDVWAAILATDEQMKETDRQLQKSREAHDRWSEKYDRYLQESREEFEQQLQKSREEFDLQLQKSREKHDRWSEKYDRYLQESREEFEQRLKRNDQQLQKSREEFDERLKRNDLQLQKSREEFNERLKRNDLQLQKSREEFNERLKETERIVREISKEVGGVSNRLGEVAQCFFGSDLWKHFDGFDYEFQQLYPYLPLFGENNEALGDIDITLLNGEYAMAIEVKTRLKKKNVEYHVKRLEQIKKYPPAQYVGKKLLGGIAALMVDHDAKDLADELGIYVIEQSGEAVRLAPRPAWFKAREW